ncbi:SDR family NAD(P)-dependent oxidoreductase [Flavobacterium sp. XS2P39]|uniref:SDR family NAD(P)-dependent oxidoreductase n=1 Tax=Flavobacterium sp. XS2P39 TaxID=3401725 RepID=UPI003AAFBCEC
MHNYFYTLITGASEGFGKALAIECATRKMNLILVALPDTKLYAVAESIKQQYKVDVIVLEKDLTIEENCILVFKEVEQLKLSVNMLINNAGIGSTMLFSEGSLSFYQKQLKLNVIATTLLTSLFLEMLKSNKPSHILNVGSLCSFFFLAKKQVYGATKSYIYFFSKSLRRELKSDGINVSVICPGGMNTNSSVMITNKANNWLMRMSLMNPEDVAPIAIKGLLNRKEIIIPGRINKLFLLADKLLPPIINEMISTHHMKKLKSVSVTE